MSDNSNIEWTDATWNPVRGCTKISPGCKHCYAETFAERFRGVPGHPFEQGFDLRLVESALELPIRWRTPRRIFVNSMSDLFHDDVPEAFIKRVFDVMRLASQHEFQVLTKRSDRLVKITASLDLPDNVWAGVSVENEKYTTRIDDLRRVPARVRFLSVEPLLGPIPDLNLRGIHWVIVGGESGRRPRPMSAAWVRTIRDRCICERVPFFFKQWGGVRKHVTGRILDGRTWDEMPNPGLDQRFSSQRSLAIVNG
ncbi:MAG: phage Gp37/Gp68 family protein [Polyangiaceae bacterium]|jgi:protein gp37